MFNLSFEQVAARLNLGQYLSNPTRFYSSAGSFVVAAGVGGLYGLIGRVVYPNAGIIPLNYAVWFGVAYQIKLMVLFLETRFHGFMRVAAYFEKLENVLEDDLELKDQIRYHCWKVIQLKNKSVKTVDGLFSKVFSICPYDQVNEKNVYESSFLEMSRYRIWGVFKSALLDSISSKIAYHLSNGMGFSLPSHTAVPLFIVIRTIAVDILLIPSLYLYAHFCNRLAKDLGEEDAKAAHYRAFWIRSYLPAL